MFLTIKSPQPSNIKKVEVIFMLKKLRKFIKLNTLTSKCSVLREIHKKFTVDREDIFNDIMSITPSEYETFSELLRSASSIKSISHDNCTQVYSLPIFFTKLNKTENDFELTTELTLGRSALIKTLFSKLSGVEQSLINIKSCLYQSDEFNNLTPFNLFDLMNLQESPTLNYISSKGVKNNSLELHKFVVMIEVESRLGDLVSIDDKEWSKGISWVENSWSNQHNGYELKICNPVSLCHIEKELSKCSLSITLDTYIDSYIKSFYAISEVTYQLEDFSDSNILSIFHSDNHKALCKLKVPKDSKSDFINILSMHGVACKSVSINQPFKLRLIG
jgi:hypothetical protein